MGIPKSLFDELVHHLRPFETRFVTFKLEEVVTLTMLHIRQADSFTTLVAAVNRVGKRVEKPVKYGTISAAIRKCILILVGKNPYKTETQENPNHAQESAQNCFYYSRAFNGLRDGPDIGKFYHANLEWYAHDLETYLEEGLSWFDKYMQQSRLYLEDQVERLKQRPLSDYVSFIDNLPSRDFGVCSDRLGMKTGETYKLMYFLVYCFVISIKT